MSKLRPVVLAVAASVMTAVLVPFSAGSARADVPPPNVQPPGVPFGLCSVVDQADKEHKCPRAEKKNWDDDDDNFPFDDKGGGGDD